MEGGKLRIVLSIALIIATIANYAAANVETPLTAHSYVTASASVQKGLEMGFQNFKTCIDQCPQGDEACLNKCAEGFLPKDAEGKGLLLLKARFEARLQFCINGCELLRECEKAIGDAQAQCSGGCTNFCTKTLERDQVKQKQEGQNQEIRH